MRRDLPQYFNKKYFYGFIEHRGNGSISGRVSSGGESERLDCKQVGEKKADNNKVKSSEKQGGIFKILLVSNFLASLCVGLQLPYRISLLLVFSSDWLRKFKPFLTSSGCSVRFIRLDRVALLAKMCVHQNKVL